MVGPQLAVLDVVPHLGVCFHRVIPWENPRYSVSVCAVMLLAGRIVVCAHDMKQRSTLQRFADGAALSGKSSPRGCPVAGSDGAAPKLLIPRGDC
jgi:hypothetical protein